MRTTPLVRVADPYDDTAMKSNSTGQVDRAGEIGHEHERALEDADEQRRIVGVVGRDLLAELADALLQLVLVDDDRDRCSGRSCVSLAVEGRSRRLSQRKRRVRAVTRTRSSIR